MHQDQEEFFQELLNDFKVEATENLESVLSGLLTLEKGSAVSPDQQVVEGIFRNLHSLKGAARAVSLSRFEHLCMCFEGVFHAMKKGEVSPAPWMFDRFFQATDHLKTMLVLMDQPGRQVPESETVRIAGALKNILVSNERQTQDIIPSKPKAPTPYDTVQNAASDENQSDHALQYPADSSMPHQGNADQKTPCLSPERQKMRPSGFAGIEQDTLRVNADKLLAIIQDAESLSSLKSSLVAQVARLHEYTSFNTKWIDRQLEMDSTAQMVQQPDHIGHQTIDLMALKDNLAKSQMLVKEFESLKFALERSLDDLMIRTRQVFMQPFTGLFQIVPRIVRDLSQEYGKQINLRLEGGDAEIDRRIIEAMKDPLIHLIRNCIDHGIEVPEVRLNSGKPSAGTLFIRVVTDPGQQVMVEIGDDGAGIQRKTLIESAIGNDVIAPEEAAVMPDGEVQNLVFRSGVTTSKFITEVSGRGLGMAIVAEKITAVGGFIEVDSTPGQGTKFTITLPKALATFTGILVEASDQKFLVPTQYVTKGLAVQPDSLIRFENGYALVLEQETVRVVMLSELLGLNQRTLVVARNRALQALVLSDITRKAVVVVDHVLGEIEGVVKSLGPQIPGLKNVGGACFLGDGTIVPVLAASELLQMVAETRLFKGEMDHVRELNAEAEKPVSVLMAEDSITVRNMLRGYLENAGFMVTTAVDGQDAYEKFQQESFDIVVSDVEMPRINGFELTEKIRRHNESSEIPVILVTALENEDDRTKGLEAGANAYIGKSSFEKNQLIETIKRLT